MLSFQDQHWAMVPGFACFQVYIPGHAREPGQVHWSLDLEFRAIGPQWRRVRPIMRPSLSISVSSFAIGPSWTHLARTNFWNAKPDPNDPLSFFRPPAGELFFTTRFPPAPLAPNPQGGVHWRVVEHKDAFFLIELAADPFGGSPPEPIAEASFVLADGTEETGHTRDDESMKEHASLYLVEWVPFGVVSVRTPTNADPIAYARGRARQLLGLTHEPEHVHVSVPRPSDTQDDPYRYENTVRLHYHSYFNNL